MPAERQARRRRGPVEVCTIFWFQMRVLKFKHANTCDYSSLRTLLHSPAFVLNSPVEVNYNLHT